LSTGRRQLKVLWLQPCRLHICRMERCSVTNACNACMHACMQKSEPLICSCSSVGDVPPALLASPVYLSVCSSLSAVFPLLWARLWPCSAASGRFVSSLFAGPWFQVAPLSGPLVASFCWALCLLPSLLALLQISAATLYLLAEPASCICERLATAQNQPAAIFSLPTAPCLCPVQVSGQDTMN
jgi:hypothetical protein